MCASAHYLKKELYDLVRNDPKIFDFLQKGSLAGIWYQDLEHPDITRQKQAEEALRTNERFLSSIFDAIRDGISVLDRELTIVSTNAAMKNRYAQSLPLEGKKCYQAYHGREAPCRVCPAIRAFETGLPEKEEVPLVSGDPESGVLELLAYPMLDDHGIPVGVIEYLRDISETKAYEKRLADAAGEWQSTIDAINSVVWLLDKDFRILRSNKTVASVFNRPVDKILGRHCWEVVHDTRSPPAECPLLRAAMTLRRETLEIRINDLWYEITVDPILNPEGGFEKAVHILTDITERKLKEDLLKEREQLYRSLFENNISIILLIDPASGRIFDANPSASAFYGYPRDRLRQMRITDLNTLPEQDIQREMEQAKSEKRNYFNFCHRVADGSCRDVEVYSGPISVGGRPLLCSIIHDVSDRMALEAEREELITRLRSALDEIKTLEGIVPICSHCNKIRDDRGYWNRLEAYIEKHSAASFSHGVCPDCSDKLYGHEDWYIEMKKKKDRG